MPPLHPNPPRLVTVALALALLVVGTIVALPIGQAVDLLAPLADLVEPYGIELNQPLGFLCLLAGDALLVAGSLLPGL